MALLKEAEVLVVATPAYKGSYTGVLKVLLDFLPAQALAGKRAVPVVTAGVAPQAAAAEALLRQLLTELGAEVAPGLPVVEADLPSSAAIAAAYAERERNPCLTAPRSSSPRSPGCPTRR